MLRTLAHAGRSPTSPCATSPFRTVRPGPISKMHHQLWDKIHSHNHRNTSIHSLPVHQFLSSPRSQPEQPTAGPMLSHLWRSTTPTISSHLNKGLGLHHQTAVAAPMQPTPPSQFSQLPVSSASGSGRAQLKATGQPPWAQLGGQVASNGPRWGQAKATCSLTPLGLSRLALTWHTSPASPLLGRGRCIRLPAGRRSRLPAWHDAEGRDGRPGRSGARRQGRSQRHGAVDRPCARAGVTRPASGARRCAAFSASTARRPASAARHAWMRILRAIGDMARLGRRIKLLVGKPGLDGHSNGAEQIAVRARDCGMDVVLGIRLTPAQIVRAARQERAHHQLVHPVGEPRAARARCDGAHEDRRPRRRPGWWCAGSPTETPRLRSHSASPPSAPQRTSSSQ